MTYGVKLERSDDLRLPGHPAAPTLETLTQWCAERRDDGARLAVDLFSGAGGLSLGLEQAGWTVALAADHDGKALQTHAHNFAGLTLGTDLSDTKAVSALIDLIKPLEIDLVAGGPPCQPFSRAGRSKIRSLVAEGRREAHDDRRELWQVFLRIALAVKPRAILMENVPDMALGDDFHAVRTMVDRLEADDYYTQVRLVDTWTYGVPQHRKRLIVLARLDDDQFAWPETTEKTTLRQAISDLPSLAESTGGRRLPYVAPAVSSQFAALMRRDAEDGVVYDHMTRPVRADDRQVFELMDSKTLYSSIPAELRRYSAETFDDKYKRLDWEDLSRSITAHIAKDGYWYIHPQEHRTLTVREAARIQTFPDRFRFAGTRSDGFRQIGNAVPPMLGQAAAAALSPGSAKLRDNDQDPMARAVRWRDAREALTRWARARRKDTDLWYLLPGPDVTPPVAAVSALLARTRTSPSTIASALEELRGTDRLYSIAIMRLELASQSATMRAAVNRLRPLLNKQVIWRDIDRASEAVGLRGAEDRMFRVLCGEDVLLSSQSAVRVAARVAGTDSSTRNRLSDGRVDLSRLVGAGRDAPLRMAALQILGSRVCTTNRRGCDDCPLAQWCAAFRDDGVNPDS